MRDAMLYTTEEVARYLRLDVVTVRRLVSRGELKAYKIGNEYRFDEAQVSAFLRASEIGAGDVEVEDDLATPGTPPHPPTPQLAPLPAAVPAPLPHLHARPAVAPAAVSVPQRSDPVMPPRAPLPPEDR